MTNAVDLNAPQGAVRVTTMQPHGMTDYLHRREIVVEIGLAVLGWNSVIAGTLAASDVADIPIAQEAAPALVSAGALVGVVATTTLLGQRRLLAAPLRAQDEEELVTADIVLAVGVRDLLATTMLMTVLAAFMTLFLPDPTWWLVATFTPTRLSLVRRTA